MRYQAICRHSKTIIMGAIFLLAGSFTNLACTNDDDSFTKWKDNVKVELQTLDNDLRELKAELKGEDLSAAKHEAIDEAEELWKETKNKFDRLKDKSQDEAKEMRKSVQASLDKLKNSEVFKSNN